MNRKLIVPCLVGCLTVGGALIAQEGRDIASNVEQLQRAMNRAELNNNSAWLEQHLADGYVEGTSWGEWVNKAENVKQTQDKSIKFTKGRISGEGGHLRSQRRDCALQIRL